MVIAQEPTQSLAALHRRPLRELSRGGESEIERIALDTSVGMAFSNIIIVFLLF